MKRPSRRQLAIAGVVAAIAVAGVVAAALTVIPQSGTVATQTDSGLTIRVTESVGVPSGNRFTPTGLQLQNVEISAADGGEVTVDTSGATWTNTSGVSVGQSDIRLNRNDTRPINVSGSVNAISVRSLNLSENDQTTEVVVDADSDWVLEVSNTGLSAGRGVVAVQTDTGEVLDSSPVEADGSVRLDELEAVSNAPITVKRGASELRVFDETQPDGLVSGTNLRIRFIQSGNERVIEREVQNGRVDLAGVPRDQRVTVTVDESDSQDYSYRRITLDNVQEQQSVYLLNTSRDSAIPLGIVFELNDRTGQFAPAETVLQVQKPITKDFDGDGETETEFRTVAGDVVGASGEFPATLAADNRYRLVVFNDAGDRRVLGSYVARESERSVLRIGEVSFDTTGDGTYAIDLQTVERDSNNDGSNELFARVVFRDPTQRTQELSFDVSNESGVQVSETVSGPLANYTATFKIADNASVASTETLTLDWEIVRSQPDGPDEKLSGQRLAGDVREIAGEFPVDPRWLELIGYVTVVAVAGLVVVVDASLAAVAAVVVGGILTILGILSIPLPALGLGGAVAVMSLVGRGRS